MSLGSVAERFLFVFNSPFPPRHPAHPLLHHPSPQWSLEIDSHLILCRNICETWYGIRAENTT